MPIATAHAAEVADVPKEYRAITSPIGLREKVNGEPMIERFARDQIGRQFLIAFDGESAEVFVHKQHLIDRTQQESELVRSGSKTTLVPQPRHANRKPYETTIRPMATSGKNGSAEKTNGSNEAIRGHQII